jgi:hypothetical protein
MFRGRECVESLARLHHKQRNTAYALCLKGKAHAEMVEYQASASAFEQCRRVDPNGLETMEVYRCGAFPTANPVTATYSTSALFGPNTIPNPPYSTPVLKTQD